MTNPLDEVGISSDADHDEDDERESEVAALAALEALEMEHAFWAAHHAEPSD